MSSPNPPAASYQLNGETASCVLNGYGAINSPVITSPFISENIAFEQVAAGTYTITWSVTLAGTLSGLDVNNFALYVNGVFEAISINPAVAGTYPQTAVVASPNGQPGDLKVLANVAGTTGAQYSVSFGAVGPSQGGGNGTARWTPGAAGAPGSGVGASRQGGYSVDVSGVAVSVAPAPGNQFIVSEAQCSVYTSYGTQSATANDFMGQTAVGSHGDTCSMSQHLVPQDWITATWSGGDAGATATMRIIGNANPPGA